MLVQDFMFLVYGKRKKMTPVINCEDILQEMRSSEDLSRSLYLQKLIEWPTQLKISNLFNSFVLPSRNVVEYVSELPNVCSLKTCAWILNKLLAKNLAPTSLIIAGDGGIGIIYDWGSQRFEIECGNAGDLWFLCAKFPPSLIDTVQIDEWVSIFESIHNDILSRGIDNSPQHP